MRKSTLIILLATLLALTTTVTSKEGCSSPYCQHCSQVAGEASCNVCFDSFRVFKKNGKGFTCQPPVIRSGGVPHCGVYSLGVDEQSDLNNCSECSYGFFQVSGKCFKNQIKYCLVESRNLKTGRNECSICMQGYIFSINKKTCVPVPSKYKISKCLFYQTETAKKMNNFLKVEFKHDEMSCAVCQKGYVPSIVKRNPHHSGSASNTQQHGICLKSQNSEQCSLGKMKESGCWKCNQLGGWFSTNGINIDTLGHASQICSYSKARDMRELFPDEPTKEKNSSSTKGHCKWCFTGIFMELRSWLVIVTVLLTVVIIVLMTTILCLMKDLRVKNVISEEEFTIEEGPLGFVEGGIDQKHLFEDDEYDMN